jgi:hypothetical protein
MVLSASSDFAKDATGHNAGRPCTQWNAPSVLPLTVHAICRRNDMTTMIEVNPITREAHGYCAELLPELVTGTARPGGSGAPRGPGVP